ncbi:ATP-binding protein [Solwaraspora sp. WMMB335]|uniref:ATP-binding protein n=1 Tax=Solwaraspora sp. WMMB335 TaxID=3404118 RepID=UPI003B964523
MSFSIDGSLPEERWALGTLLAESRRARGLTQEALAELTALSVRAIREMERGRVSSPQRRTVSILADALGWSEAQRNRFLVAARVGRLRRLLTTGPAAEPAQPDPAAPLWRAPAELPPAVADLAGRDTELAALRTFAGQAAAGHLDGTVVALLHGPPGTGKTSLAVAAGHRFGGDFPDGQLFVDLRGPVDDRRHPHDVLGGFLRSLSVDAARIPVQPTERAGLYRTVTRRRRLLVVLDNAADEAQVRPLLPAGHQCLVLVTSRRPLSGLEGVHRIALDELPPDEAYAMLGTILGTARAARETAQVDRLVDLCGRLPLALRIAGNRLASRPGWQVGQLVEQLDDQRHRLTGLKAGDLDVRAAFEVSYRQLSPAARQLFRLAALVPGDTFGVELAAALAGVTVAEARRTVEEVVDVGLLSSSGERYRFHDLIGLYAEECLAADEAPARAVSAHERMTTWLLGRTAQAGAAFLPAAADRDAAPRPAGVDAEARAWLTVEASNWTAALRDAVAQGRYDDVVRTVLALHWYSDVAHGHPWPEVFQLGVAAARAANRVAEQAALLNFLGWALACCEQRYRPALRSHEQALRLATNCGDQREQAWARAYAATLHGLLGRPARAAPLARRASAQFRELGHGLGEHYALAGLASALNAQGDHAGALEAYRAILRYYRQDSGLTAAGVSVASAAALRYIAQTLGSLGRWPGAAQAYAEATRLYAGSGAGPVLGEAHAVYGEGIALRESGRLAEARVRLRRAIQIYAYLDNPWGQAQAMHALAGLTHAPEDACALLHLAAERCAEVDDAQSRAFAARIQDSLDRLADSWHESFQPCAAPAVPVAAISLVAATADP